MARVVRRNEAVKVLGTIRHSRATLMMSTALQAVALVVVSLPVLAQPAPNAQPTGGTVVGGAATIAKTATTTTINQTTQRAAIDWQSFNVGSQQTVTFQQPNASAVALNRVVGPDPSQIAGRITANGQIILQNQSGVIFNNGAQVATSGLMVTAVGITNQNFMNGNMVFDQAANPNAKVVNQGTLTVRGAGLAALVAPAVANSGIITAKMGNVVLAGAQAVTLDMYGDGLVSVNVTKQVTQAPDGTNALVTNTGVIRAAGGTVTLTAAAADGVVTKLVSAGGTIAANTVGNKTGTISIAGIGGDIEITGQLSAQGLGAGTAGGAIQATASGNVALRSTAVVNASGRAGGGTVAIGTTLARAQGGRSVTPAAVAKGVTIASGATIAVNATDKGNGGKVAVLSTGTTTFAGSILARGGPTGGDGGFVETSGATLILPASAFVDTQAPLGIVGNWLLDPVNFTIVTTGGNETPGQVVTALKTSDVTILADNDITVTNAIDATTDVAAIHNLILQAGRSIAINANIKLNGGAFSATANDSTFTGLTAVNRGAGAGGITMAGGTTIDTSVGGNNVTMSVGASAAAVSSGGAFTPGTISLASLTTGGGNVTTSGDTGLTLTGNIAAGSVSFTSGGSIAQSGGTIGATGLAATAVGAVTLTNANAIGTIAGTISTAAQGFSFNNTSTGLTVDTVGGVTGITTNNGNISLTTATSGDLTLNQNIGAGTGTVALTSAGSIVQSGGSITAAGLALKAANSVSLPNANAIGTIGGTVSTAAQGFSFNNTSTGLTVDTVGGVTGLTTNNGNISLSTTTSGDIRINQTVNAGTGTLSLNAAGNISQPGGSVVAGVLIGNANSFVVGNITNLISTIGAVTSTLFHFFSNGATTIEATVSSSGSSYIEAIGNLTVLGSGSIVGTGNVTLDGANGITLNGGAVVGHTGVQVDLSAPHGLVTQAASSTIIAGTLTSGQGFKNGATLSGTANAIGSIGGISIGVSAGAGDFTLVNGGSIGVIGPLTGAGTVSIKSGTIGVTGSLSAATLVALAAGAGGIAFGTGHFLNAPTLDLATTGGGINQTGGTINASAILQSTAGVTGTVSLLGSTNTIAAIGNFAVTSGDLLLNDGVALSIAGNLHAASGNIALTEVAGQGVTLAATNGSLTASGTVSVQADTLGFNAGATITGQAFEWAPVTPIALTIGGGTTNIPSLTQVGVQRLRVGAVRGLAPTATSITFGAIYAPAAAVALDLEAQGNIADGGFALTNISTLSGNVSTAGSVVLNNIGNGIATLGNFAVTGGDFNLQTTGSLNETGVVTAGNITLNAGTLGIAGFLNAGTAVMLGVTAGGVTEAGGSIAAGTLTSNGTVVGGATLTSNTNTIATLANFAVSAGDFSLTSTGNLNVAGTISGPNIVLNAGTIGIAGFVNASTAVALGASAGGVTETGSVTAGTSLTSISTIVGGLTLTGTNTIPTLGNIVVVNGSLSVSSAGIIQVSGTVSSDSNVIILGTGAASAIIVTGSVTGASPTTGLVTIGSGSGGVTLANSGHYISAGTVDLFANGGTVTQPKTTSGSIYAGTLQSTGSNTSAFSIRGKLNTIGALGVINVGGAQEITAKGALTLKNAITANSLTLTAGGSITDNGTALLTVGTLYLYTTAAGDVSLTNGNDQIGQIAGVSLFAGGLKVIDDPTLILSGTQTANSFYYMVSKAGDGIQLGNGTTPLSLTASGGGRISLIGDMFSHKDGGGANQLITTGVVEIAPLTNTVAMSIGGTTSLVQIDSTLLNSIQAGTLIAGSYLNGSTTITAANVLLDGNVSAASVGALRIATLGTVHQSLGSVTATGLGISAGGATDLTGANAIGTIAASIAASAQSFILDNTSASLTVDTVAGIAGIATNNGTVTLVTSTAGNVTLNQSINAGTAAVSLSSAGTIGQTGGLLTAASLTGTAVGGVALTKTNSIGTLQAFAVTGGDFSLVDGVAMVIGGNVSAKNLFLESALNGGTIAIGNNVTVQATAASNPRATFVADILTAGSSSGIAATNGSIEVSAFGVGTALTVGTSLAAAISAGGATSVLLGQYTDVPNGGTAVTMTGNLIVAGSVAAKNITATAGTIGVSGFLNAGTTLALGASAGSLTEAGTISAATLVSVGTIAGGATLTSINNSIGTLGNFAVATGTLAVNDTGSLSVAGPVSAPSVTLAAGTLDIAGLVSASARVSLGASLGGITESTGSVIAGTLVSNGAVTGGMTLNTAANTIGALGAITIATGSLAIADTGNLAVVGPVSAADISLNAGTISIAGTLNAGTVMALGASAGGISETGAIAAATLTSSGTVTGNTTFNGTNTIAALGRFAVTGGDFSLTNTGATALLGEVDAKNITLQSTGSIGFSSASFLNASTNVALGSGAAIVQPSGTISGTLISVGMVQGGVTITSSTNAIPALGSFSVSGGDFTLTTTGSLGVNGAVVAPNIAINTGTLGIASTGFLNAATTVALGASAGNVTESGSIFAATLVSIGIVGGSATLNGTNTIATVGALNLIGALTLNDTAALTVAGTVAGASASINPASLTIASGGLLNAGSVTVITSAGGVTENGTGRIIANTLSIATTGTGDVSLTNANNQISASNGIQVANGNLILVDDPTLTLTGPFSAHNLFFQVTQAGDTIALSTTTLTAATNGRISLVADNLTDTAATKISAPSGTVEIAPFSTTVAESLSGAAQMAVDGNLLAGIGTGTLTIGGYTDVTRVTPGQSITAANIALAATNLTGIATTLNILTLGSISGAAGALVVGTLSGTAASSVNFSSTSNTIGVLGSFGVTSGSFTLMDNGNTGNLNVVGPITASSVNIGDANTGTITVSGLINAPTLLALAAGSGGVKFNTGTILTSTTVDLSAAGGGLTQGAGDGIVATTLQSSFGVVGTATLNSALNNIATLGAFGVSSGDFTLADNGNTGRLTVSGPVTAGNITISNTNAATIAVTGSIGATTILALSAGSGGIQLNTGAILSGATVDLSTTGGGVNQVSTGTILASTVLRSPSGVTGTVNLAGTANAIASVGSFAVSSGDFTLVDTSNLGVAGVLTAANISLNSATITVTGSLGATTGLALASGSGGIHLNTGEILSGATVDLSATGGGVTQVSTGTIAASTVLRSASGVTGTVNLAGTANTIASVGSFAVSSGDFTLLDTGNLGVAGKLTATNISLNSPTITVTGSIGATTALVLTAGSGGIQLNTGEILSGATVDLSATGGGVTQVSTGTIAASTVLRSTSGVTGTVNLAGVANNVASLGSFAVTTGDFVLADNGNTVKLSVTGPVTASNATVIGAGTIAISGSIGAANAVVLASGAGGIQLNSGGILHGAVVDLSATGGGVTETGTGSIIASGTLQSTAGVTGTVALTNTGNNIPSIGSFAVTAGDFIMADNGFAGAFDVTGALTANNVAISGLSTVTLTGRIGATTGLTLGVGTGGIQLIGGAILSGATVDLSATGGGGTQVSTGSIVASAVLRSTSGVTGTVNLTNAGNTIAGLGKFAVTSGDFVLGDAGQAGNLTVSGPVTAANVTIGGASTMTVAGSIGATTLVSLAAGTGGIALTGSAIVNGPTVDLSSTGGLSEAAGGSVIASSVLRSSNGVAGSVALTSAGNNVASLGSFILTSGNFALVDTGNTGNLSVTGPVTAANVSIVDGNTGTISVGGSIGAVGFLALASGLGGIRLNSGEVLTAATVDLSTTGGGVNQVAGGVVSATVLTSSNGLAGALVLPSSANQIGAIANVTVAGDLTLVSSIGMSLAGQVSVGHGGTVNISTSAGGVTQAPSGTLIADTFTSGGGIAGNLSLTGAGNQIGTLSAVTAIGLLAVADSNALTLAGLISAGGGIVDLSTSAGGVTQAAGSALIAATLTSSGNVAGTLTLGSGSNQIGTLSGLSAGGLTLFDATGLTLANLVSVGGAGTMDITTPGGINQSPAGVLIAGTLTSSGGLGGATALLGAGNQIRSVNNIVVASGNLSLNDSIDLAVIAKLSAHQITVTNTGRTVSFANGAQIVTDGIIRPPGTILPADLPTALKNTNGGAYFTVANFQQTGTLNASNLNGSGNILRIDATGTVAFDSAAGLNGPNTWLIMSLVGGAQSTGAINVKALDVNYIGAGSGASLSGSINGVSGQAAASLANIVPGTSGDFKINTCALHAVNCIILTAEGIPQIAPSSEIVFAIPFIPSFDDNPDIVVPLVSDTNDTTLFESDIDKKDKDRRRKAKQHGPGTHPAPPAGGGNDRRTEGERNVLTPRAVAERDLRLAQDGG